MSLQADSEADRQKELVYDCSSFSETHQRIWDMRRYGAKLFFYFFESSQRFFAFCSVLDRLSFKLKFNDVAINLAYSMQNVYF